jgi:hypothetical protein
MKTVQQQLKEAIADIEVTGDRALIAEARSIARDASIPEEYRAGKIDALRKRGSRTEVINESGRRAPVKTQEQREPLKAAPNAAALIESQVAAYKLMGMTEQEARICAGDETAIREAEEARKKHIGRPTTIDRLLETTKT